MKRFLAVLCGFLIVLGNTVSAFAEETAVSAYAVQREIMAAKGFTPEKKLPVKSAVLMEAVSGRVLYEDNGDERLAPASVTKIMPLLLAMEALESGKIKLTDKVACSENAASYGGSQIWLEPGEEMTVDELLKAVAVSSANDATICLGEYIAGSETAFIAEMNRRAKELSMENTNFLCAEGLDAEGHYSSAKDIAIMSRQLLSHEKIKDYTTIWMDSLRGGKTQLTNTNRLVRFYRGATGLKTGTTEKAGCCLSASAERDGLSLVAVVMGAKNSDDRFMSARALLDWGFANYASIELTPPTPLPIAVEGGVKSKVNIKYLPPKSIVTEKGEAKLIAQKAELPELLKAPVKEGEEIGRVKVLAEGKILAEYPVIAAETVEKMTVKRAFIMLIESFLDFRGEKS